MFDEFKSLYINPRIHLSDQAVCGRGFLASDDIPEGELLMRISFDDCLWPSDPSLPEQIALAQSIQEHFRDPNGKFHKYISEVIESKSLDNLPCMWDSCLIEKYRGSSFFHLFNALMSDCPPDLDRIFFAYMLSRSFVSFNGPGHIGSVPIGDLFNHSTLEWNTRIRESGNFFEFYSEKFIPKNFEILNLYGNEYCDLEMMMTHGFIDRGLNSSCIMFPVSLMSEDGMADDPTSPLVRIDVGDEDLIIPPEFSIPLPEFIPSVEAGLKRAVDRMIDSSESTNRGLEFHAIFFKPDSLYRYRDRLS
jgi:hypothetical protein